MVITIIIILINITSSFVVMTITINNNKNIFKDYSSGDVNYKYYESNGENH